MLCLGPVVNLYIETLAEINKLKQKHSVSPLAAPRRGLVLQVPHCAVPFINSGDKTLTTTPQSIGCPPVC
jgi:hypothetical protein